MKCYMLWQGGPGYGFPHPEDLEEYASLAACKREFERRPGMRRYPCVLAVPVNAGGPEGFVFFAVARDEVVIDNGPDRVLSFGPRGGLVVARG